MHKQRPEICSYRNSMFTFPVYNAPACATLRKLEICLSSGMDLTEYHKHHIQPGDTRQSKGGVTRANEHRIIYSFHPEPGGLNALKQPPLKVKLKMKLNYQFRWNITPNPQEAIYTQSQKTFYGTVFQQAKYMGLGTKGQK